MKKPGNKEAITRYVEEFGRAPIIYLQYPPWTN
jgi:hypothetical protein